MTVIKTAIKDNYSMELCTNPHATVELVAFPEDPFGTVAKLARGYTGVYSNEMPTPEEIDSFVFDVNSTQLQTPFEMLKFVFLFTNVSRSFTHQLVRTRIGASYVQESMRFLGHKGVYRFLCDSKIVNDSENLEDYADAGFYSIDMYERMIQRGTPSESARGILPTDIMTSVFVGYDLPSLQKVYTQRMCCQSQPGQWQVILKKCKDLLISVYGEKAKTLLSAPYERGKPCGYRASFDRPCIWQKEKVEK
jgi:thymidylate synthase ThyX